MIYLKKPAAYNIFRKSKKNQRASNASPLQPVAWPVLYVLPLKRDTLRKTRREQFKSIRNIKNESVPPRIQLRIRIESIIWTSMQLINIDAIGWGLKSSWKSDEFFVKIIFWKVLRNFVSKTKLKIRFSHFFVWGKKARKKLFTLPLNWASIG